MGTRFVIVGDVHGRFEALAVALDVARRRWGPFGFVLAVGDVEPNRGWDDHLGVVGAGPLLTRTVWWRVCGSGKSKTLTRRSGG